MNTLGSRIRSLRKEKELTQANVAKAVGVSSVAVTQWEQNSSRPGGNNLLALAKVLNCDPNWLLNGQGSPEPEGKEQTPLSAINDQPSKSTSNKDIALSTSEAKNSVELKYVELDFYDVEVSAGHGTLVIQEEQGDCITFSRQYIDKIIGVNIKNVFIMPIRGDSMTPTLKNQALVMVNRIEDFSGDGIYVFRFDGQLMVKRLQFSKIGLTVVSDNTNYKEWELSRDELATEDFEIIGEVVWSGQNV